MSVNLKDFLKPTKGKLIILGLTFFLTIYLGGVAFEFKIKSLQIMEKILSPHYLLFSYLRNIILHETWIDVLAILIFPLGIIYWYFISCLLIFIYKRFKERLRKR